LSNAQKLRELQDTQEERDGEKIGKECDLSAESRANEKLTVREEFLNHRKGNAKMLVSKPQAKVPRSLRVGSLNDLPASFTAEKNVINILSYAR
jgi:hypothetical protein